MKQLKHPNIVGIYGCIEPQSSQSYLSILGQRRFLPAVVMGTLLDVLDTSCDFASSLSELRLQNLLAVT
jgi:uncharacterized membrane protein